MISRGPALRDQVYSHIRDRIVQGTLEPGRVIVEVELAAELNVSRTPVSNALVMLKERGLLEDYARNYEIDGIMWCNERKSPLDDLIAGNPANDFSPATRREALERNIDVERVLIAFHEVYEYFQKARRGEKFRDGALVEFLRVLLRNPEILIWERFWLERNKDLDRELYGMVK